MSRYVLFDSIKYAIIEEKNATLDLTECRCHATIEAESIEGIEAIERSDQ